MLTFAISLAVMLVVVAGAVQWAVRAERRRVLEGEGHARDH
jgi:hypothetical protein